MDPSPVSPHHGADAPLESEIRIDVDANPSIYEKLFREVLDRSIIAGVVHQEWALRSVCDVVRGTVALRPGEAERVHQTVRARGSGSSPVGLSMFIRCGVGNAQVLALAAGALLGMLRDHGYMRGDVRICRGPAPARGGRHHWASIADAPGLTTVVDAVHGYVGSVPEEANRYAGSEVLAVLRDLQPGLDATDLRFDR